VRCRRRSAGGHGRGHAMLVLGGDDYAILTNLGSRDENEKGTLGVAKTFFLDVSGAPGVALRRLSTDRGRGAAVQPVGPCPGLSLGLRFCRLFYHGWPR
jgi:hypothetical protein